MIYNYPNTADRTYLVSSLVVVVIATEYFDRIGPIATMRPWLAKRSTTARIWSS